MSQSLGTRTYYQNRAVPFSMLGGVVVVCAVNAFFLRFDHPDVFYEVLGSIAAGFGILLLVLPPKIVLTQERIQVLSFGWKILDLPWAAIAEIALFRSAPVHIMGRPAAGGQRRLGFQIRPEWRDKVRTSALSRATYGYDVSLASMWSVSIDEVAAEAARYRREKGGSGEVKNLLSQPLPPEFRLDR